MISTQILADVRRGGGGDFIVTLIISLFISKLYNFDPCNNKCKSLSLDKIIISESRL